MVMVVSSREVLHALAGDARLRVLFVFKSGILGIKLFEKEGLDEVLNQSGVDDVKANWGQSYAVWY